MSDVALEVFSLENVSGITSEGTRPYLSTRSDTPVNVPPSLMGFLKKYCTRMSSMGLLALSMMPCRNKLAFSSWSQKNK